MSTTGNGEGSPTEDDEDAMDTASNEVASPLSPSLPEWEGTPTLPSLPVPTLPQAPADMQSLSSQFPSVSVGTPSPLFHSTARVPLTPYALSAPPGNIDVFDFTNDDGEDPDGDWDDEDAVADTEDDDLYPFEPSSPTGNTPGPIPRAFRRHLREVTDLDAEVFGMDCQAIDWSQLPWGRDEFRARRLASVQSYRNIHLPEEEEAALQASARPPTAPSTSPSTSPLPKYFHFRRALLRDHPQVSHFQLRNLLWCTSKNDVFFATTTQIRHLTPHTSHPSRPIIDLPSLTRPMFKISTMCAAPGVVVAGGWAGEFAVRSWEGVEKTEDADKDAVKESQVHLGNFTRDPNGITNHIEIEDGVSGAPTASVSSNDNSVRLIDLHHLVISRSLTLPFAPNCTSTSPPSLPGHLAAVGDDTRVLILDPRSATPVVAVLEGHRDFSFAVVHHPSRPYLVSGCQDKTVRVWDLRLLGSSVSTGSGPDLACTPSRSCVDVLGTRMGAVRSLRFTPDGSYLAVSEPSDFMHLWDSSTMQFSNQRCQEMDFFGEIAGTSFSPDGDTLWVGNADETYGGVTEYARNKAGWCAGVEGMVRGERVLCPVDGVAVGMRREERRSGGGGGSGSFGSFGSTGELNVQGRTRTRPYWYVAGPV